MMGNDSKIKILFISPLPPPTGGIARWTEILFNKGLPENFQMDLVNTNIAGTRKIFSAAKMEWAEVVRNVRIIYNLIKKLVIFRPAIIHLCCSLSAKGILRDYLCAVLGKLSGTKIVTHYRGNVEDFPKAIKKRICLGTLKNLVKISDVNLSLNLSSFRYIKQIDKIDQSSTHYLLPTREEERDS